MKIINFMIILLLVILIVLFLQNDRDNENKADLLYKEALVLWDEGKYKDSISKLDELLYKFNKTKISKKAYEEKMNFEQIYNRLFKIHQIRNDIFSAILQKKLEEYYKSNIFYPQSLNSLNIDRKLEKHLDMCKYTQLPMISGYKLDCKDLDELYTMTLDKNIESVIPINTFFVYFTKKNGVDSKTVTSISLNKNNIIQDIKSELVSTYWIGYIKTYKTKNKRFIINQNNGTSRIIINNKEIYKGSKNEEITQELKEGIHKVEVYHKNNTSKVDFDLKISDNTANKKVNYLNNSELRNFFNRIKHTKYEPVIASVIGSSNNENSEVNLYLKKSPTPIVLFLSSYYKVNWNIINTPKNEISAIVYSSRDKYQSTVNGDISDSLIIDTDYLYRAYSYKENCICHGSTFNCQGSTFLKAQKFIKNITSKELKNFTGGKYTEKLLVPEYILNKSFIKKINTSINKINIQQRQCEEQFQKKYKNRKLIINRE